MQAVILAAGKGSRLKGKTENQVKCMVEVNGESMISRLLHQLEKLNLNKIIIVDGYLNTVLENYIDSLDIKIPIEFIFNKDYNTTNNIFSVFLAKSQMSEDETLLIESDLIFNDTLLQKVMECSNPNIATVSRFETWMDGTVITKDATDNILSFVGKERMDFLKSNQYFKTVNVYKFSKEFSKKIYFPYLDAQIQAFGKNEYYETVLKTISLLDSSLLKALDIGDEVWYEIDDVQDLDIAESLFSKDKFSKLAQLESRFGGYWRYPKLIDFCYLVNPFFPPERMISEFQGNAKRLIVDYPSGLKVNSSLVAKYYDIPDDEIIIGNGAAELIKALLETVTGKLGVIAPTFEEYPNRLSKSRVVKMYTEAPSFSYDAQSIIDFFSGKEISYLVLINPDNPSGNYLSKNDIEKILIWAKSVNVKIILDESFNDFVNIEKLPSFINKEALQNHSNLIIIKSISKSFGVPGVRLGFLCTSDKKIISELKKNVSIWNINSFGEFFLQIFEKYRKDYSLALDGFYTARETYRKSLTEIPNIVVVPSQSNYFMIELLTGNARELTANLLENNIFVKDLSKKDGISGNGEYLRVAVKTPEENQLLVDSLSKYLNDKRRGEE